MPQQPYLVWGLEFSGCLGFRFRLWGFGFGGFGGLGFPEGFGGVAMCVCVKVWGFRVKGLGFQV